MEQLLRITANSSIFVLTGAGISKESGVNTFRDQGGLWENHKIDEVASPEGFRKNPDLVYDFYNKRRKELNSGIKPNKAHYALYEFEKTFKINIITYNINSLHETTERTFNKKNLLNTLTLIMKTIKKISNAVPKNYIL